VRDSAASRGAAECRRPLQYVLSHSFQQRTGTVREMRVTPRERALPKRRHACAYYGPSAARATVMRSATSFTAGVTCRLSCLSGDSMVLKSSRAFATPLGTYTFRTNTPAQHMRRWTSARGKRGARACRYNRASHAAAGQSPRCTFHDLQSESRVVERFCSAPAAL